MGETSNPDVCHRSVVGHASQCEVTHTSTRAGINIPIPWSLTTTDEGLSLSRSVIATDIPTFCQVCVISLAKANSTLNPLQAIFIKWSTRNIIMPAGMVWRALVTSTAADYGMRQSQPKLLCSVILDRSGRHAQGHRAAFKGALGKWRLDVGKRRQRSVIAQQNINV